MMRKWIDPLINIVLPADLVEQIKWALHLTHYNSVEDFIIDAIRKELKRRQKNLS